MVGPAESSARVDSNLFIDSSVSPFYTERLSVQLMSEISHDNYVCINEGEDLVMQL